MIGIMEIRDKITDFWPTGVLEYVETLASIYVRPVEECNDEKVTFTSGPTFASAAELAEWMASQDAQPIDYSLLSNVARDFVRRHNEGKLTGYFTYADYVGDEDIQGLLRTFGIDREKFWLLLLFAYDYSESMCVNGVNVAPSALEELRSLVRTIQDNTDVEDWCDGCVMKEEAKMTLKVKGQKSAVVVESPTALCLMATVIKEFLEENPVWETLYGMNWHKPLPEPKSWNDSPYIYYFAKMLLNFLRTVPTVRAMRKKGANHSVKEMELVSRLVYFTKLSTNKNWLDIESQTLKAYLKQYKSLDTMLRRSSVYDNFLI